MKKYILKYSFIIFLLLTYVIMFPIGLRHIVEAQKEEGDGSAAAVNTAAAAEPPASPSGHPGEGQPSAAPPESPAGQSNTAPAGSVPSENPSVQTVKASGQDGSRAAGEEKPGFGLPHFTEVPHDYFDDALFIGDSRTVGISEYGGLDNAAFFADKGMSAYNVFSDSVSVKGVGKTKLSGLLKNHSYGKVYIMLGINELGYDFSDSVDQYQTVIDKIRQYEPTATIFIEANLHVTAAKSEADSTFNNENINRFNDAISKLADGRTVYYLDVNPVFDDGSGNLAAGYSGDGIHVYGKCYETWGEWIGRNGIIG